MVSGNGLNVQDFTFFANVYGTTRAEVTADRFYDKYGIDPNAWLEAAAILPTETSGAAAETARGAAFALFAADDRDEYEWFDFDAR